MRNLRKGLKRIISLIICLAMCLSMMPITVYAAPMESSTEPGHGPSENYAFDDVYHYFSCIDSTCTNEEHKYDKSEHDYVLKSDEEGHWLECKICPYSLGVMGKTEHQDDNNDGTCDLCDAEMTIVRSCGSNAKWIFRPLEKTLTIIGEGSITKPIADESFSWFKSLVWDTCIIEEGITEISDEFFTSPEVSQVETIYIAESVTKIGINAFTGTPLEKVFYSGTANQWKQLTNGFSSTSELMKAEVVCSKLDTLVCLEVEVAGAPCIIGNVPENEGYAGGFGLPDRLDRVEACSVEWQVGASGVFTAAPTYAKVFITLEKGYTIDDSTSINFYDMDEDFGYKLIGTPDGKIQIEMRTKTITPKPYHFVLAGLYSDEVIDGAKYIVATDEYGFSKLVINDLATDNYLTFDAEKAVLNVTGTVKMTGPYHSFYINGGKITLSGSEGSEFIIEGMGAPPLSVAEESTFILDGAVNLKLTSSGGSVVDCSGEPSKTYFVSSEAYSGDVVLEYTGEYSYVVVDIGIFYLKTTGDVIIKYDADESIAPAMTGKTINIEANSFYCNSAILADDLIIKANKDVIIETDDMYSNVGSVYIEADNIKLDAKNDFGFVVIKSGEEAEMILLAKNDIEIKAYNGPYDQCFIIDGCFVAECKNFIYDKELCYKGINAEEVNITATDTVTFNFDKDYLFNCTNANITGANIVLNEKGEHSSPYVPPFALIDKLKISGDYTYNAAHKCSSYDSDGHICDICGNNGKHDFNEQPYILTDDKTQHYQECKVCGFKTTPADHEAEVKNKKDATCTEKGYTGDKCCKDCGIVLEVGKAIDALGHTWDAGKVTKEPTKDADGVKTFTCTRCGETKTEVIDKLTDDIKPTPDPDKPDPTPGPDPVKPLNPEISVKGKYDVAAVVATMTDKKPLAYAITKGNKKAAKITKKGILTAKKADTLEITAYSDKKKKDVITTVTVVIKDTKVPTKDMISYMDNTCDIKSKITDLPAGVAVKFSISEKQQKIATVDAVTGIVTPVKNGKVKVLAEIGEGNNAAKFYTTITIKTPQINPSKSVVIAKDKEKAISLKNVKADDKIEWSVSDITKAEIIKGVKDSKIKVKGLAAGKVTLTADVNGHKIAKEIEITE